MSALRLFCRSLSKAAGAVAVVALAVDVAIGVTD